ncbi:MAG: asparagine--tRNA ligase [Lentisphaerae bacterium GWF2_57_35]|nr:MAG: asparagine--tRNA ligase [Lentisphaerae bacterium GWF2_57_35]
MKQTVFIKDLRNLDQQEVTLHGWVVGKRSGGKIVFLLIRDGTGTCQCIVEAAQKELFDTASSLGQESSLSITGKIRLDSRAPGGAEMSVTGLQPIQVADNFPIARKSHGIDFLMTHRHLWLRSPRQTAILRIRHTLIRAVRRFFDDNGFTLIDTPILSPGAAEGAGTLFPVDYFGEEVYLAQTGQLYLESAAMALGKVYCFGPTFRAEKSKTRRHLTEFWMVEPEIAFAELPDLAEVAEAMLCALVDSVLKVHREDLAFLGRDVAALEKIKPPFPRITYTEAVELLHSPDVRARIEKELQADRERLQQWIGELDGAEKQRAVAKPGWPSDKLDQQLQDLRERIHELDIDIAHRTEHLSDAQRFEWGNDFGGDEETIISRHFDRPVVVTKYPRRVKAFYMKVAPDNPEVVLNMDVLAPEGYGEIVGGSQREDQLDVLLKRMAEEGMNTAPYEWYLDLRRYGSVPHGGFGLGIERTVSWICGLKHIRETIPFPRLMGRIYP